MKLVEAIETTQFKPYTAGYIKEDGSLIILDEYHGEDKELVKNQYPEFSNTHPEEDTCVRIFKKPTEEQYKELEKIIDYYLTYELYCKVEIRNNFYEVYSMVEGACQDPYWNEHVGNWTGEKLVLKIRQYFSFLTEHTNTGKVRKFLDSKVLNESMNLPLEGQYLKFSSIEFARDQRSAIKEFLTLPQIEDALDDRDMDKLWKYAYSREYSNPLSDEELPLLAYVLDVCDIKPFGTYIPSQLFWRTNLVSIVVPEGVTEICACAFQECHKLIKVILPNTLDRIEKRAFAYSGSGGSLDITLPASLRFIDSMAFFDCSLLHSVEFKSTSLTCIAEETFCNCNNLESINVPKGVKYIFNMAFAESTNLKNISLPSTLIGIASDAFYGSYNIENISFAGTKDRWEDMDIFEDMSGNSVNEFKCLNGFNKLKCSDGYRTLNKE